MKLFLSLMSVLLLFLVGCRNIDTEYYLLPENFIGRVTVIFDQDSGSAIKYEGGKRIYEIPANGILRTQFHYEAGRVNHHYYYCGDKGKRTELSIINYEYYKDGTTRYTQTNKDKVVIMGDGTYGQLGTEPPAKFQFFFVSSINGLDTIESYQHYNMRVGL